MTDTMRDAAPDMYVALKAIFMPSLGPDTYGAAICLGRGFFR
jgi:hypothetical protein